MKVVTLKVLLPDLWWAMLRADDYSEQAIIELLMKGAKHHVEVLIDESKDKIDSDLQTQAEDDIEYALGNKNK